MPRSNWMGSAPLLWVSGAARSASLEGLEQAVATSPETHTFEPVELTSE